MTVHEYELAQSLTSKPVKGMLTGGCITVGFKFQEVYMRVAVCSVLGQPCRSRACWQGGA